jgi:hypothetical protein
VTARRGPGRPRKPPKEHARASRGSVSLPGSLLDRVRDECAGGQSVASYVARATEEKLERDRPCYTLPFAHVSRLSQYQHTGPESAALHRLAQGRGTEADMRTAAAIYEREGNPDAADAVLAGL